MKQIIPAVFSVVIFFVTPAKGGATEPKDSVSRKGIVYLELTRRIHQLFRKSFVVGTVVVEEEGFRFIAASESPEGFISQERFEKEFWYNPLFKELYIPFSDLRSIKRNGRITTKHKKMYLMTGRDREYWNRVYGQIKAALPARPGKKEKMYDKFAEVLTPPSGSIYLELYRRGSMHFVNKVRVPGSVALNDKGFRFIPTTQLPPDYPKKELFDRIFWYNSMMGELYIPYSELKSVRRKMYFRTTDGNKYILFSRLKHWKATVKQVKTNIPE